MAAPGAEVSGRFSAVPLWPDDIFGDFDHGLNTAINKLRETLGDTADRPRYVETVPRRGYRFIGAVEAPAVPTPALAPVDLTPWRRQRAALTIALAIAVCVAVASFVFRPDASVDPPVERFTFVPKDGAATPVISPDGKRIAYIGGTGQQTGLVVQDLNRFEPREIAGSAGALLHPSWSPDSRQLVFATGDKVWRVPATGGEPALISQFKDYMGSAWRPDGLSLLLFPNRVGIYEVAPAGGVPRLIFPISDRWGEHFENPWFLTGEDGGVLLYAAQTRAKGHVSVLHSLKTGKQEIVALAGVGSWSPSGHIVYAQQSILWGLPFSLTSMKATGEAFPIATDVGSGLYVSPSVSRDGALVYLQDERKWHLKWLDENGGRTPIPGTEERSIWSIALSPDLRTAAISIFGENADVWLHDLSRGTRTRLGAGGAGARFPSGIHPARASRFARAGEGTGTSSRCRWVEAGLPPNWSQRHWTKNRWTGHLTVGSCSTGLRSRAWRVRPLVLGYAKFRPRPRPISPISCKGTFRRLLARREICCLYVQ